MIMLIDGHEPTVLLRGDAARRVIDQARLLPAATAPVPAPADFRSAMRRVEAEVYDAA